MDKLKMKEIRRQVRASEIRNDLDYANSQPNENELEKFIEIDTDLLERLMILLDDIDEVTDISGDMNSKDLLFEIKIIFDEYNK